ncbi:M56 family metallopeptidase [Balneolales bacterium ANBcel1]|nr:M56 family metallopeptidase [Balneolales bacterium ANBcel1]
MRFKPRLILGGRTPVPCTFGTFRPVIIIPEKLRESPQKLNMAVRHELIHIRRGDSLLNMLMMLTITLFWFIPLLHLLFSRVKMYRELSCDRDVLSENGFSRKEYAELLFEMAMHTGRHHSSLLGMSIEPSILKKRIENMNTKEQHQRSFRKSLGFLFVTLLAITVVISCSDIQSSGQGAEPASSVSSSAEGAATSTAALDEETVYTEVEIMPEMEGGIISLYEYLTYPDDARAAGIEGQVVVQFVVDEEGRVTQPQVVRSAGGGLDEAALDAIEQVAFTPGRKDGTPVKVEIAMPISFRLSQ